MKIVYFLTVLLCVFGCSSMKNSEALTDSNDSDLVVVFASCNDSHRPMPLWKPILENAPEVFIWGGDNVYADTNDIEKIRADYELISQNKEYQKLQKMVKIIGTWDDHDYGKNDAGKEWEAKEGAKDELFRFLGNYAPEISSREGIYHSYIHEVKDGVKVKFILLDTRSFRDELNPSSTQGRRYEPWPENTEYTFLGEAQWTWLQEELQDTESAFTVIVSSVQFLSNEHGYEKWGNFPNEVQKMEKLLQQSKSQNIFFLSGDRHLAEISKTTYEQMDYPIVDFTSSGLTHTWLHGATEANPLRISNVIKKLNFGVLRFDLEANSVTFKIRGEDNFLYETYTQQY
jgi:alkaline phosphatase D